MILSGNTEAVVHSCFEAALAVISVLWVTMSNAVTIILNLLNSRFPLYSQFFVVATYAFKYKRTVDL